MDTETFEHNPMQPIPPDPAAAKRAEEEKQRNIQRLRADVERLLRLTESHDFIWFLEMVVKPLSGEQVKIALDVNQTEARSRAAAFARIEIEKIRTSPWNMLSNLQAALEQAEEEETPAE